MFGNSDSELVRRMKRGDASAYAAFVDEFGPVVLRLARRYTDGCEADAEDITQEIFVALCRGIGTFRGDAKLSTYVYRIAMNHCLKHLERRKARGQTVPLDDVLGVSGGESDPQIRAAHGELSAKIGDALATLSDGHREVVILHELHGLTYSECASVLGVPVGTVKSRLFHAFGRLRNRLGGYVRGDEDDNGETRSPSQGEARGQRENGIALAATSIGKLQ